ncbi:MULTISPECIES: efflux RND transporter periplasmic adaptor subunit [Sphingomonas]|uniref:Efflux RND transporter periplasmic adaptor subunit n=1 Tax=Edaphosphingomonas fennica TaxID=114404 RepID=A0A2T4I8U9_9SPHN|nr:MULTISPECIES: efflux RND transporter periplasmic adaptor subunit [Sphingomonas]AGH49800.1 HlyD family secretion protein [Sphingomonas sp. MM-1]MDX3885798.1 efflux RND transporter periplasmic adaptor subunit [Sphingomonas sp.]PTD28135.1 efflux RND transporter periplasmic adaptor subunit [Sphingomonas fennica]
MPVVTLKSSDAGDTAATPPSGGAMDRIVERKRLPARIKIGLCAAAGAVVLAGAWWLAPSGSSQTVAASHVAIGEVRQGVFEDFLPLRARVTPLVTVYLDAVEGGRVEKVLVEDGATVVQGQLLAVLSNADLQLSVLARQTEVTEQLNNMRSQELALERNRLDNQRAIIESDAAAAKAHRQYEREAALVEKGWVAKKTFADTAEDYNFQQRRAKVLRVAQATDERLQSQQLAQLRRSAESLQTSLAIANANLDALNLRAPVSGQLTAFSIQVGQSMKQGERLGQIDSPGRNKLVAGVDEFYLGRIQPGQTAVLDHGGKPYRLKVAKIYPQVRDGQFEVDLQFVGPEPAGIQRGQGLQAKLTLSDPAPARIIPNGAFYNDTGGAWVFVVSPDGRSAEKRSVRLGRRNSDFIEVLDGLEPGERIVTSPYTGLTDKARLDLSDKD